MPNVTGPILNEYQAVEPVSACTRGIADCGNASTSTSFPVARAASQVFPLGSSHFSSISWMQQHLSAPTALPHFTSMPPEPPEIIGAL